MPTAAPAEPQGLRTLTDRAVDSAVGGDVWQHASETATRHLSTRRARATDGRRTPTFTIRSLAFRAADHIAEWAGKGEI